MLNIFLLKHIQKILFIIAFSSGLIVSHPSYALRIPNSLLTSPFVSQEGFHLNNPETGWIRSDVGLDTAHNVEAFFKRKNQNESSTLSIRIDKETTQNSLHEYAGKWVKSYSQFALTVLGHRYFKNKKDERGFVIEILNPQSSMKYRQAVFFKNSKAVILTCMNSEKDFKNTIKPCNEMIQTFSWDKEPPQKNL